VLTNILPISGSCGAVVSGVDLRKELSTSAAMDIRTAIERHLVLIWPRLSLSASEQVAFTRQLGPPSPVPFIQPTAEHSEVIAISRRADESPSFDPAGGWHSDFSFLPVPPSYTVLQAIDVPPFGGDTIWSNQYLAYQTLSAPMKDFLSQLSGVHSAVNAFSPSKQAAFDALAEADVVTGPEALERQLHPVVIVHPDSGRPALFVNREYTVGLMDLSAQEAQPLLDLLAHHSTRPEFTCRWRWSAGDVVVWDNRCLQHMAMNDYRGHARKMLRTTVHGSHPLPFAKRLGTSERAMDSDGI
jgi:taurine dioxygenase